MMTDSQPGGGGRVMDAGRLRRKGRRELPNGRVVKDERAGERHLRAGGDPGADCAARPRPASAPASISGASASTPLPAMSSRI